MTVFVAGGSGTIGVPLVRALVASGHRVVATTRTRAKAAMLEQLGATPAVVDALDADALAHAVRAAAPTHVIHQLTALPPGGVRRAEDLAPTNRLRDEGTRNLMGAAAAAGARRVIAGSFAMLAHTRDERDRPAPAPVQAVRSMESQVLDATQRGAIEGIVLRYGLFYGPGVPATAELVAQVRRRRVPRVRGDGGRLPWIHIDDAVSATVAALDHGVPGRPYEVVDDQPTSFSDMVTMLAEELGAPRPWTVPAWVLRVVAPYMARLLQVRLTLSNADARRDLGWSPRYPGCRDGMRALGGSAG